MHSEHGSWLNAILHALPESWHHYVDVYVVNSWVVIVLLVVLAWLGTRHRMRKPSGLQNVWEMYVQWVRDYCRKEIGPGGEKHAPLLGTIFIYILFLNLFGLVPGFITPTMTLNMTVPLAMGVFLWVQWSGIAQLGLGGYIMHFVGEPAWLAPLNIVIHVIGELAKPLSLSIRLFGNMFGEETALMQMAGLGAMVLAATYIPFPVQFINVALHLLIGPIQAFIFFALGVSYVSQITTAHQGEEHHEDVGAEEHTTAQPAEQAA